jgi:hypothetical protein
MSGAPLQRRRSFILFLHEPQPRDFGRRGRQNAHLPQHVDHRALDAFPGSQIFNPAFEPLAVSAGQRPRPIGAALDVCRPPMGSRANTSVADLVSVA